MPDLSRSTKLPKYSLHRATGQARVCLCGRDHYLGPYGSPESRERYDRLIAEWLSTSRTRLPDRTPGPRPEPAAVTVSELILAYKAFCEGYYQKDGRPTGSLPVIKRALRPLRKLYGSLPVNEFGPACLKAVRQTYLDDGLSRGTVNKLTNAARRCFKWGASEELVPPGVWHGLLAVEALKRGRTTAPETEPVRPVSDGVLERTLDHLPRVVADMARVQRLLGCRPGEVCQITTGSLDTSGPVWEYRPPRHKTEHLGKDKVYPVGPKAQAILRGYLRPELDRPLFSPADSEAERSSARRAARASHPSCNKSRDEARRKKAGHRQRPPKDRYTAASYGRAVRRAAEKAGVPAWHPHQLRHTRATEVRREFGLDAAAAVLGNTLDAAEIYAERDRQVAREVARRTG